MSGPRLRGFSSAIYYHTNRSSPRIIGQVSPNDNHATHVKVFTHATDQFLRGLTGGTSYAVIDPMTLEAHVTHRDDRDHTHYCRIQASKSAQYARWLPKKTYLHRSRQPDQTQDHSHRVIEAVGVNDKGARPEYLPEAPKRSPFTKAWEGEEMMRHLDKLWNAGYHVSIHLAR